MTGKKKCRILREIRKQFAEDNGITYLSKDCGSDSFYCDGHCTITQAEERFLENELNEKAQRGERINLQGISFDTLFDALEEMEDNYELFIEEESDSEEKEELVSCGGIRVLDL